MFDLKPEYTTMSRRPGIAGDWFDKYKDDVYPSDTIHLSGREMRPPKFYVLLMSLMARILQLINLIVLVKSKIILLVVCHGRRRVLRRLLMIL
jgi:hypothetical protein